MNKYTIGNNETTITLPLDALTAQLKMQGLTLLLNHELPAFAAPPPASEGELTEGQFCKLHSAMHGEEIDHVDQLVFSRMTGRELYEFVKFCVATLPTMEPEAKECKHGHVMFVNMEWGYFCLDCGKSKLSFD